MIVSSRQVLLLISQIKIGILSQDFNSEIPAGHIGGNTTKGFFREASSKSDKHWVNTSPLVRSDCGKILSVQE